MANSEAAGGEVNAMTAASTRAGGTHASIKTELRNGVPLKIETDAIAMMPLPTSTPAHSNDSTWEEKDMVLPWSKRTDVIH